MQIVQGDNLHEMSEPIFWEKYDKLSSAGFGQRIVKVNHMYDHVADSNKLTDRW